MPKAISYFPRERAKEVGIMNLNDYELLALILRTGKKGEDVLVCARNLLHTFSSIEKLREVSVQQLKSISGIGESKAISILAAIELGRRAYKQTPANNSLSIASPKDCVSFFELEYQNHYQECFLCLLLNTKNQVVAKKEIYRGGLQHLMVHPREIFRAAISVSAAAIILLHNHPSGDPAPSTSDIETTKKLLAAAQVVGIPILDHIIIGKGVYKSMKEHEIITF